MIRLQDFRIVKFSLVENARWPLLLKIAKLIIPHFLQNGKVYLAEILYGVLVGP